MEKKTKDIDRKNKEKGKSQVSSVWGGRFTGVPSDIMEKINPSIDFDKRFFVQYRRVESSCRDAWKAKNYFSKRERRNN